MRQALLDPSLSSITVEDRYRVTETDDHRDLYMTVCWLHCSPPALKLKPLSPSSKVPRFQLDQWYPTKEGQEFVKTLIEGISAK